MVPKISVVMATYDDYQGVYFTIQDVRKEYQDLRSEIQFVVVDNNPDSEQGRMTRNFVMGPLRGAGKYVPYTEAIGTCPAKNKAVSEADAPYVLGVDSHVLLYPGSLRRLMEFFNSNHSTSDLYNGPLVYDEMTDAHISTHFDMRWRTEMWGTWGKAWACNCGGSVMAITDEQKDSLVARSLLVNGQDQQLFTQCPKCGNRPPKVPYAGHESAVQAAGFHIVGDRDAPFDIPGNGMGCFAVRKDAWLKFPAESRGFGGEEICIQAKYRQAGHRALCLPWLKWVHRFGRPGGVPYPLARFHKIRNYVLAFRELGWALDPIKHHFVDFDHPGETLQQHLTREHGVDPLSFNGADIAALEGLHRKFKISEYSWQLILDGKDFKEAQTAEAQERLREAEVARSGCGSCGNKSGDARPARTNEIGTTTIDEWYAAASGTPNDFMEHVPVLRQLASQCQHVTEFTLRQGISTAALLAARPERLVVVAESKSNELAALERLVESKEFKKGSPDTQIVYVRGQSGRVKIEDTDLLFIKTIHTANRLLSELEIAAGSVRRYIALHGTEIYGENGQDGGPGLLPALRLFMRRHPEWSVIKHYRNSYGFTVVSRNPDDKPALPGKLKMAWNYGKAFTKHKISGSKMASDELVQARLDVCSTCEHRSGNRCTICGCYLDEGPNEREGKALWLDSECPIGKWPLPVVST